MTSDLALTELAEPDRQFCYRHLDRETWVRCGRCDRPICTACAMQGPVGMRCRDCGKPVRDAFTSMTARQWLVAGGLALGAGLIVGYIGMQFGWFALVAAFFAGRITVDVLDRANGIKRGPRIIVVVSVGLLIGTLAGGAFGIWSLWREIVAMSGETGIPFDVFVLPMIPQILIGSGVAIAGAVMRLR